MEVLAVAVRGAWQPAAADELGRVVSWRLPVHVAVTDQFLEAAGQARLYDLSAVTSPGGDQAPPFAAYWFERSRPLRLSGVP